MSKTNHIYKQHKPPQVRGVAGLMMASALKPANLQASQTQALAIVWQLGQRFKLWDRIADLAELSRINR